MTARKPEVISLQEKRNSHKKLKSIKFDLEKNDIPQKISELEVIAEQSISTSQERPARVRAHCF